MSAETVISNSPTLQVSTRVFSHLIPGYFSLKLERSEGKTPNEASISIHTYLGKRVVLILEHKRTP